MVQFESTAEDLAEVLKRLRAERRLSLDAAAQRTGISRRLLVGLERGAGNPSLSTLLRLAAGYGVGLADLVAPTEAGLISVRAETEAVTMWATEAGSFARLLIASTDLALWDWQLAPGDVRNSEPHRPGTQEIVRLQRGRLALIIGEAREELTPGHVALFPSDRPHRFENPGRVAARFVLVVHEPLR